MKAELAQSKELQTPGGAVVRLLLRGPLWLRMLAMPLWIPIVWWRLQVLLMATGVAASTVLAAMRLYGLSDLSWFEVWVPPILLCSLVLPLSTAGASAVLLLTLPVSNRFKA